LRCFSGNSQQKYPYGHTKISVVLEKYAEKDSGVKSVHEPEHPERYSVAKADFDIIRRKIRIGNTGNLFFPLAPPTYFKGEPRPDQEISLTGAFQSILNSTPACLKPDNPFSRKWLLSLCKFYLSFFQGPSRSPS
jgi:hypothetical protein